MRLSTPTPILRIFDEAKAREFSVEFLGFTVDWEHRFADDLPLYLQISRDECVLHLSEHDGDASPGSAARIFAERLDDYHRELKEQQHRHNRPGIEETPWDTHEMTVQDPFGNRIVFYEPHA